MGEILFFAISSDRDDPLALRMAADTLVRRRLLAVAGVSQVTPIGGAERQFQVIAHPDQLRANSIPVNELLDAVRGASQNTSAGIYMEGPQEHVLQTIGRVRTPEEIGESVVALRGDRSVLIRISRTSAKALPSNAVKGRAMAAPPSSSVHKATGREHG